MIQPDMNLISLATVAIMACSLLNLRERKEQRTLKCPKCGSKKMRARNGLILCKNGHKVTLPHEEQRFLNKKTINPIGN
jgi:hypothetical protein